MPATLHLDTWAGRRTYRIRIKGETRAYFRFEASEDIPMPSRRWIKAGQHGRTPRSPAEMEDQMENGFYWYCASDSTTEPALCLSGEWTVIEVQGCSVYTFGSDESYPLAALHGVFRGPMDKPSNAELTGRAGAAGEGPR